MLVCRATIDVNHCSQFHRSHLLLDICWAAVEDPEQGLLVEALDLALNRLYICHAVTIRQPELPSIRRWSRRRIVEKRVDLGRERPVAVSGSREIQGWKTHS